jgi:predicted nucleic acid-binding protein
VILVDTSVWVDHLRGSDVRLAAALEAGEVLVHPFVIGEIACGNVGNRAEILHLLGSMPQAPTATNSEALGFIERHSLMGRGIGYVDVHLLAAAVLAGTAALWTRDQRLAAAARDLGLAFDEPGH